MQSDYHFYAIYALCRLSGIRKEESKIIAYSSQHTDDAKYDHALNFENGGRFQQGMSAHQFISPKVVKNEVGYDIFIPFHFLPSGEGEDFWDKIVCRKNSGIARSMIMNAVESAGEPAGLHGIGIALHVYADTWSHQNFSGLLVRENGVTDIKSSDSVEFLEVSSVFPPLGHAQANKLPDIPFMTWSYEEHKSVIDNTTRCLEASEVIYKILSIDLRKYKPEIFTNASEEWEKVAFKLKDVFAFQGSLDERIKNWEDVLSNNHFGFSDKISYDDREWFNQAVQVEKRSNSLIDRWNSFIRGRKILFFTYWDVNKYTRLDGFSQSNWKYFHDALIQHRYYLKHVLLPQYDIYL